MPFKTGLKCRFKCGDAAMAELFGHEKLIVYQKGMRFAVVRGALLAGLPTYRRNAHITVKGCI